MNVKEMEGSVQALPTAKQSTETKKYILRRYDAIHRY
jgi:hypothetical protein